MTRDETINLMDAMEFHRSHHNEFTIRERAQEIAERRAHLLIGNGERYAFPVHTSQPWSAEQVTLGGIRSSYYTIVVDLPAAIVDTRIRALLAEEQIRREYRKLGIPLPDLSA